MAFPVTLNGRTYTLADFSGTNYVDGFPDALEDFVTQAGNIYATTSTSSVAIGSGSKTFTVADSGKPYTVGTPLRIADAAAPATNWIDGIVTSYSGTTLVVNAVAYAGSGTKASWNINIGGGPIAYTGTLPVAQGGTGATTEAAARTNLDVYSKSEADSRFLNVSGEASDVTMTGNVTIGDAGTDTLTVNATATMANATLTTADINGGTIDGTVIGGSTPAAISGTTGSFTNSSNGATVASLSLRNFGASVGTATALQFLTADATPMAEIIGGRAADSGANGQLIFNTRLSSVSSERMRITSAGNVGISNSIPSSFDAFANRLVVGSGSSSEGITIYSGTGSSGALNFADGTTGDAAYRGYIYYNHSGDSMGFYTAGANERLRITSTGSVGIGTSSPMFPLDVAAARATSRLTSSTGTNAVDFQAVNTGGQLLLGIDSSTGGSLFGVGGYTAGLWYTGAYPLVFGTNNTERMRIDADGILIAGAPAAINNNFRFNIQTNSGNGGIVVKPNADTTVPLIRALNASASASVAEMGTASGSALYFSTAGTERVRVDASGNVGIGLSSPNDVLNLYKASRPYLVMQNATTGTSVADGFWLGYDSSNLDVQIRNKENAGLLFFSNDLERARIDASGKLGVGTAAPNGRVTVQAFGGVPTTNLNNLAITTFGNFGGGIAMIDSVNPNSGTGYGIWVDDSGNDFNIARGTTSSGATGGVYINDNAGSWSSRSDERDKTNLEPITDAASKVQSLRAVIGEYIWAEGVRHPFLIAQDVQAVLPEAVSIANKSAPEGEQRLGMSYTDMVPLLTAALQEALTEIADLKARITALEG